MSGGLTLDASALIAFERNDRAVVAIVARAQQHKVRLAAPAGVVGQVWRDGARQARLARLLGSDSMEIVPLDDERARAAGQLCGVAGTPDVIDASVVLCARERGHGVLTCPTSTTWSGWMRRCAMCASDGSPSQLPTRSSARIIAAPLA